VGGSGFKPWARPPLWLSNNRGKVAAVNFTSANG